MKNRIVMHVDMDYFYAACEEKLNPELKGRPLVICVYSSRGGGRGAVSTANYEARRLGIRSGMSCLEAKRLAPAAVFLPANFSLYEEVSEGIMAYLRDKGDAFEQIGIDEAFLDVTDRVGGSYEEAERLAAGIKRDVYTTEGLTCSIGVAPNKLVAKIASGHSKPDGLTVVPPWRVEEFLSPLGVSKLWGVGGKTAEALREMGIITVGDLSKADPGDLIERFGRKKGSWLYNASRGLDYSVVRERTESRQLGRITTLPRNTRKTGDIIPVLDRLCREVSEALGESGRSFRTVTLVAVTQDMRLHTRSRTLEAPVRDAATLMNNAVSLLEAFLRDNALSLRRVGVRVSGLVKAEPQKTLFDF